eukprot:scaffold417_cov252-Pinguiococcus_pyrenoidosus.AAC.28
MRQRARDERQADGGADQVDPPEEEEAGVEVRALLEPQLRPLAQQAADVLVHEEEQRNGQRRRKSHPDHRRTGVAVGEVAPAPLRRRRRQPIRHDQPGHIHATFDKMRHESPQQSGDAQRIGRHQLAGVGGSEASREGRQREGDDDDQERRKEAEGHAGSCALWRTPVCKSAAESGADSVADVDGTHEAGEDVVSELREAEDVARQSGDRHQHHQQSHEEAAPRQQWEERQRQGVGGTDQLLEEQRDGSGRTQHQQRLTAQKRMQQSGAAVHEEVLGDAQTPIRAVVGQGAQGHRGREGGEEHEQSCGDGLAGVLAPQAPIGPEEVAALAELVQYAHFLRQCGIIVGALHSLSSGPGEGNRDKTSGGVGKLMGSANHFFSI